MYAVLAGPPDWRTGSEELWELPEKDGRRQWWEEDTHRQRVAYEIVETKPPGRLVMRIAQPGLPFGGGWTFEIAALPGGGSEVRISEDGDIATSFFALWTEFLSGTLAALRRTCAIWASSSATGPIQA